MRNLLAPLLSILIFVGCDHEERIARLEKETRQLKDDIDKEHPREAAAKYDLRAKCATQARKEFDELGWNKHSMADFTNHYNSRLNKCFIQIGNTDTKSVKGTIVHSKMVSDAFEGVVYGSYIWSTEKGKKYWEVPPLECKVTLQSGEEKVCHSSEEFDSLVKQYMTE